MQRLLPLVGIGALGGAFVLATAFMTSVPFNGDEQFYAENARMVAEFLTGRSGSVDDVVRGLVSTGWWMPGVSFVLTPVYVVEPDASFGVVRVYLAVVYLFLWIWTVREVDAALGPWARPFLFVFPTLAAMWLMFASAAWGDLPAGLCVAIVAARGYRIAVGALEGDPIPIRHVVVAELAMVAMVYLRGNTILVVAVVHGILLGAMVLSSHRSRLWRHLGLLAAGGALFGALLAPWSVAATRVLDDTVVTTSSAPLALAVTFGNQEELCFGPCPPEGVWAGELNFSRQYARERGISQLEAQRRMAAHALRDVTLGTYAAQVRENVAAFVDPTGLGPRRGPKFMDRFMATSTFDLRSPPAGVVTGAVRWLTLGVYVPFFVALVMGNVLIVMRRTRWQVLSIFVKALTISLFVQPFVHESHSRYWTTYAPVMTIAALLVFGWWRTRRQDATTAFHETATSQAEAADTSERIMAGIQVAYVVAIAAVALVIVLA